MKLIPLCPIVLSIAGLASAQVPVFISREAQISAPPNASILHFGGELAFGGQYAAFLTGTTVNFGVYRYGDSAIQTPLAAPNEPPAPGLSMSPNGAALGAQHLVWGVSQTAIAQGNAFTLKMTVSPTGISGATSLSSSVIACSRDIFAPQPAPIPAQVCAVAWTGINPPPNAPGPFDYRYYGNVNVATDYGSQGTFSKSPANSGGIPNAYATYGPVIAFRNRTLYIGFVGTDAQNIFNLMSSNEASQYQSFYKVPTPIAAQEPTLGVQGSKLVIAWIDGTHAIHIGYWNGEPGPNLDWQGVLLRHVPGGPDQPVVGGPPLMAESDSGLILSWWDASRGSSAAFITLPDVAVNMKVKKKLKMK